MGLAPDITDPIVDPISNRGTVASYTPTGAKYDISVDSLPFLLATTAEHPYVRQTAESRRQQIDTSAEPGEQTLSQWWTRSQDSWHRGAGIGFYEPGSDETTVTRFNASVGVDPWTKGELRLLKKTGNTRAVTSGQSAFVTGGISSGADVVYTVENGAVTRWTGASAVSYTVTGGAPATAITRAGSTLLVGTVTGILSGSSTGSSMGSLWTVTSGPTVVPYYVKSRIIAARGPKLYELTLAGGSMPLSGAMEFTHADANWTWSGVAEAPTAILASGYSNGQGLIYRFKLVDAATAGGSPTIGSAEVVAEFPPGEEVYSVYSYLGTYLAIGTSKGLRVGVIGSDGSVSYGPLVFSTTKPVRAITARDRFFYAAVEAEIDGSTGCYRVDLSTQIEDLRFAYATDYQTHDTGVPSSITFLGNSDRVALAAPGKGVYLQSATLYESAGYLKTGKIRLATSVGKVFPLAQMRATVTSTSEVSLYTVDTSTSAENFEFTIGSAFNTDADIVLSTAERILPSLELKVLLRSSSDFTATPVLDALTLKALPQVRVQRVIQYPLLCMDDEKDRFGTNTGGPKTAYGRLSALENLEQDKTLVVVKDSRTGESYRGWITQVQFIDTTAPKRNANFGGIVLLTVTRM